MADPAFGHNSELTIDVESAWGTVRAGASRGAKKVSIVSGSILPKREWELDDSLIGGLNRSAPTITQITAGGRFTAIPTVDELPLYFQTGFFNRTTTGAGDPYSHAHIVDDFAATLGAGISTSLVFDQLVNIGGTLRYYRAIGARLARMQVPIAPYGFFRPTFEWAAKTATVETAVYDDEVGHPTDWTEGTKLNHLHLAAAAVKIGGSAVGYVKGGNIDFNFHLGLDDFVCGGAGVRNSLVPEEATEISGTVRMVLNTVDVLTLLAAGTESSLDLTWAASASRSLQIALMAVYFKPDYPEMKKGRIEVDASFVAAKDSVLDTSATLTVKNANVGTTYD